jgi:hypothetical protein
MFDKARLTSFLLLFFDNNLWLETKTEYFPKSLEIIQFVNCRIEEMHYDDPMFANLVVSRNRINDPIFDDLVSNRIISKFKNSLPNLKEMKVTFVYDGDYGDEPFYRSDGGIGDWRGDGNVRYSGGRIRHSEVKKQDYYKYGRYEDDDDDDIKYKRIVKGPSRVSRFLKDMRK